MLRIKECMHRGKALELRLEQEAENKYAVVLAGLTIQLGGCINGVCYTGAEENYLFVENPTYRVNSFSNFQEAELNYVAMKEQYID